METIVVISRNDLVQLIKDAVKEELAILASEKTNNSSESNEALMTRVEIARYLKISLVTLNAWVRQGLPCIRKGGRVLFLKSDVLAAIKGGPGKKKR